jgi:hypothetical protein
LTIRSMLVGSDVAKAAVTWQLSKIEVCVP